MNIRISKLFINQLFLYVIVGAVATVVEWAFFYVLDVLLGIHYAISTTVAFLFSTLSNWMCGRFLLFDGIGNIKKELLQIYSVSIIGLLMNLALMFVFIEFIALDDFVSKILSTGVVFFWNFLVRKFYIYKAR